MRPLAVLLLVGTALAAPAKAPDCVRTRQEAVELARTRGKLIFLTVIVDHDGENRMVIDEVFRDAAFLKIAKEFVIAYANNEDDHGKVKVKGKDGKTELRCRDCPSISCTDHMMLAQDWARAFFPTSDARTPIHFVIDANEEVVETIMNGSFEQGFNHVPAKTVVARLKALLEKHGRGLTEEQYARMVQLLTDAKAARARDKVTLELQKQEEVVALGVDVEGVRQAQARVKEIDAAAAKELEAVEPRIAAAEWEAALDELERIVTTYPGTLTAAAATARTKELNDQSEVKRLLKARELYEAGLKLRDEKKFEHARKRFEKCARLYPETKYGELAAKEAAALGDG